MTAGEFKAWRARCGFSSWEKVAQALGMHWRQIHRYQRGKEIPLRVALACTAVELLLTDKQEVLGPSRIARIKKLAVGSQRST